MKIRNINDKFGEPIEFEAADELECKIAMAQAIVACGFEGMSDRDDADKLCDELREGVDYEVVED